MKKLVFIASAVFMMFALTACVKSVDGIPEFSGVVSGQTLTVEVGAAEVDLTGITVMDSEDGDLTDDIQIVGNYDLNTVGSYDVELKISDTYGSEVTIDVTIDVVQSTNDGSSNDDNGSDDNNDNGSNDDNDNGSDNEETSKVRNIIEDTTNSLWEQNFVSFLNNAYVGGDSGYLSTKVFNYELDDSGVFDITNEVTLRFTDELLYDSPVTVHRKLEIDYENPFEADEAILEFYFVEGEDGEFDIYILKDSLVLLLEEQEGYESIHKKEIGLYTEEVVELVEASSDNVEDEFDLNAALTELGLEEDWILISYEDDIQSLVEYEVIKVLLKDMILESYGFDSFDDFELFVLDKLHITSIQNLDDTTGYDFELLYNLIFDAAVTGNSQSLSTYFMLNDYAPIISASEDEFIAGLPTAISQGSLEQYILDNAEQEMTTLLVEYLTNNKNEFIDEFNDIFDTVDESSYDSFVAGIETNGVYALFDEDLSEFSSLINNPVFTSLVTNYEEELEDPTTYSGYIEQYLIIHYFEDLDETNLDTENSNVDDLINTLYWCDFGVTYSGLSDAINISYDDFLEYIENNLTLELGLDQFIVIEMENNPFDFENFIIEFNAEFDASLTYDYLYDTTVANGFIDGFVYVLLTETNDPVILESLHIVELLEIYDEEEILSDFENYDYEALYTLLTENIDGFYEYVAALESSPVNDLIVAYQEDIYAAGLELAEYDQVIDDSLIYMQDFQTTYYSMVTYLQSVELLDIVDEEHLEVTVNDDGYMVSTLTIDGELASGHINSVMNSILLFADTLNVNYLDMIGISSYTDYQDINEFQAELAAALADSGEIVFEVVYDVDTYELISVRFDFTDFVNTILEQDETYTIDLQDSDVAAVSTTLEDLIVNGDLFDSVYVQMDCSLVYGPNADNTWDHYYLQYTSDDGTVYTYDEVYNLRWIMEYNDLEAKSATPIEVTIKGEFEYSNIDYEYTAFTVYEIEALDSENLTVPISVDDIEIARFNDVSIGMYFEHISEIQLPSEDTSTNAKIAVETYGKLIILQDMHSMYEKNFDFVSSYIAANYQVTPNEPVIITIVELEEQYSDMISYPSYISNSSYFTYNPEDYSASLTLYYAYDESLVFEQESITADDFANLSYYIANTIDYLPYADLLVDDNYHITVLIIDLLLNGEIEGIEEMEEAAFVYN